MNRHLTDQNNKATTTSPAYAAGSRKTASIKVPVRKQALPSREAIIGLGEDSIRKNYYPELQDKLIDLERINARNRALITTIPDILLVSDLDGHISPLSLAMASQNALTMAIMRNQDMLEEIRLAIRELKATRTLISRDMQLNWQNTILYLEARIHLSDLGEVLIMIRDMTERVRMEMRLRDLADKDPLTGLDNRRIFEAKLNNSCESFRSSLSLIILDIDGLKLVNDTLGHAAGDRMLNANARLIEQIFATCGSVSRIGGDEFGILIEDKSAAEVEEMLGQLKQRLQSLRMSKDEKYSLTLSYGYAIRDSKPVNVQLLFQEADNNMYQNKLLKDSSARSNLVKALKVALEAKDYITEGHAARMENLALAIGKELGLSQARLDRLRLLTKFHDIGKVGIPDSILKKEGPLTAEEWKIMRTHTAIGERIARESAELESIAPLILRHHERWDGAGYPLGVQADQIPLECRILSIVDTFDAMTNDRPYRGALPVEIAIKEIHDQSGSQFDPALTGIFVKLVDRLAKDV